MSLSVWVGAYSLVVLSALVWICLSLLRRDAFFRKTAFETDDTQARRTTIMAYAGPFAAAWIIVLPLCCRTWFDFVAATLWHAEAFMLVVLSIPRAEHGITQPHNLAKWVERLHQWLQALDDAHDALWPRVRPVISRIVSLLLPVLVGLCIIDWLWQPWKIVQPWLTSIWDAVAGFMRNTHNATETLGEASRSVASGSVNGTLVVDMTTPNTQISHNLGLTIAAPLGLYLAYWRLRRYSQETKVKEEGHITDRFIQASEQLGSRHITVRVAAINSLWRIAVDSPKQDDKRAVLDVLCAFIRSYHLSVKPTPDTANVPPPCRADVQTALTCMGTRLKELQFRQDKCGYVFDLHGAQLAKSDWTGFEMSHVNLGEADLREAMLNDAKLRKTKFFNADLSGANLSGATFIEADFSYAKLIEADLQVTQFNETIFFNARLGKALAFCTDFCDADLRAADLHEANLIGANLSGADLSEADLNAACLSWAILRATNISGADFTNAKNLTQAQLDLSCWDGELPPILPPGLRCPANYCRWDPDKQRVVSIETPAVVAPCPKVLEDEDPA